MEASGVNPLYAKSRAERGWPTLPEHSQAVARAAQCLLGPRKQPTRLAGAIMRFFRVPKSEFPRFWLHVVVAALLHDIGKANVGFQAMVGHPDFKAAGCQVIRHEHLSAMLLLEDTIQHWLKTDPVLDFDVVCSAIVSHHLKARRDGDKSEPGFGDRIGNAEQLQLIPRGIKDVLSLADEYVGATAPNLAALPVIWRVNGEIALRVKQVKDQAHLFARKCRSNEVLRRFLQAVRCVLIVADAAASGLVREGRSVPHWLRQIFEIGPLTGEYVRHEIIEPRVAELSAKGRWKISHGRAGWSDFQDAAGELGRRALMLAACGAGKTLAAYRWVEARLAEEPAARVLFLYPTRGTATEGFRDYISWAPEAAAGLYHGTAAYDLEGLFSSPAENDPRQQRQYVNEADARLFALAQWPKRVLSATVDSFLGFMANQYAPICLLPLLADSVVVVDEIHSLTPGMFGALKRFLEHFDLPVLCMSASLPSNRKDDLARLGLQVFPAAEAQFTDLQRASDHPRYRVDAVDRTAAIHVAEDALRQGKKVLWVVNRVDDCQRLFRAALEIVDHDPGLQGDVRLLCYHSRFKLSDRRARHNEVIEAFRASGGTRVFALTTQVCEMSLDLDADVLISELAPVTSLIQRMGRCCRQKDPGERFGHVCIYESETGHSRPYEAEDLQKGQVFRAALVEITQRIPSGQGAVSQSDLARELERLNPGKEADSYSAFLDQPFWASSSEQEFREGDEFTINCVLSGNDLEDYVAARRAGKPETVSFIVPVPRWGVPLESDIRLSGMKVAPARFYDSHLGYRKPEVEDGQAD
ncbi:MAG TPA: CRISPR-associated helicase Cas3' [Phycisphaerae bacterium]|nr:CRISPR-associated helicase Cas3' [Phycisphaerae bacterium]